MNDDKWLLFFSDTQPRRHAVIRQVLSNKRTVSSLYWGMQYHILDWLNVEPELDEKQFDLQIDNLCEKGYLAATSKGLILSAAGIIQKKDYQKKSYIITEPSLFQHIDEKQWLELLPLLIQVISELSYHNHRYYVVGSSIRAQLFFKNWYQNIANKNDLASSLKQLLKLFLEHLPQEQSNIFMALFSGHETIGKTTEQVATMLPKFSHEDVVSLWRDLSMQFAFFLLEGDSNFRRLVVPLSTKEKLSKSALITYQLFNDNLSIEQIAEKRRLRVSTIKEHLLESAILRDDFVYHRLITTDDYSIMTSTFIGETIDWDYKQLDDHIEFFKFRLFQIERSKRIE
ncbi:helix-turn-helix domain-containing protein [Liquorilactobacillus mali]|uniref:Helicase Helix-turn-helix domain-containing protein n=2 Tax=Liquorilactobacillus mali TaxID=1618 RepID=A0A0R2E056_9LACO|nr:helix-turn-helix domain-containing protein [Liquorilactobacillus mali]KRN09560.1 hypothetical protein FD00_GL000970 [Liquorilactobacillus mali KCTC 3596 = DSM 20444]MDC7952161.1 helix-turn-helix domain-containing protein [Liquorilactobacillus mali]QFQ74750.1 hypothetical protein LM596_06330 [Liquorilactobacillus mali]